MKRNPFLLWSVLLVMAALVVRVEALPVATAVTHVPHGISGAASSGYGAIGLVLVLVSMLASRRPGRDDS